MKASHRAELKMREQGYRAQLRDRDAAHSQMVSQVAALKAEIRQRSAGRAPSGGGLRGTPAPGVELLEVGITSETAEVVGAADVEESRGSLASARERIAALDRRVAVDRQHIHQIQQGVETMETLCTEPFDLEKALHSIAAACSNMQMKLQLQARAQRSIRTEADPRGVSHGCGSSQRSEDSAQVCCVSMQRKNDDEKRMGDDKELSWGESQTRRIRGTCNKPKIDCWRPRSATEQKITTPTIKPLMRQSAASIPAGPVAGRDGTGVQNKGLSRFREAARTHLRRYVCACAAGSSCWQASRVFKSYITFCSRTAQGQLQSTLREFLRCQQKEAWRGDKAI